VEALSVAPAEAREVVVMAAAREEEKAAEAMVAVMAAADRVHTHKDNGGNTSNGQKLGGTGTQSRSVCVCAERSR